MAISAPNAGTGTAFAAATTSAVPFPTTVPAGDSCYLVISANSGTLITLPANWTQIARFSGTGSTVSPGILVARLTAAAAGTEGGTTVTVTHPSVGTWAQIITFSGVDPQNQLDVAVSTVDSSAGGQAHCIIPALTPVTNNVTLLTFVASNTITQTVTPAAGFTESADSGATMSGETAYKQGVGVGSTGTADFLFSGAGKQVGAMVALRPAASAVIWPANPGQTWRRFFQHPVIQPIPPPPAAATNASAENTTTTFTANDAAGSIAPNAENTTATFTSNDGSGSVSPNAENTTATFTANDGSGSVSASAENTTTTFQAGDAGGSVGANAESPTQAYVAGDASGSVAPSAGAVALSFSAGDVSSSAGIPADFGAWSFAAGDASALVAPAADFGAFSFTSNDATVTTSTVVPGVAATSSSTVVLSSGHWSPSTGKNASTSGVSARQSVSALSGASSRSWVTGPTPEDDDIYDGQGGYDEPFIYD